MADIAERFRDDIAAGVEGGHGYFDVEIVAFASGYENRNLLWPEARGRWNAARAIEFLSSHGWARAHFYKCRGKWRTFRMKDYHDFEAERLPDDDNTCGRLTGAGTTWQMGKAYGVDEPTYEYVRPLRRIVSGTDRIWVNGVLQTNGVGYTLDIDTGIVTSSGSWTGSTLEMSCEFDVPCRYDVAGFTARHVFGDKSEKMLLQWADIDIVEVRPDEEEA